MVTTIRLYLWLPTEKVVRKAGVTLLGTQSILLAIIGGQAFRLNRVETTLNTLTPERYIKKCGKVLMTNPGILPRLATTTAIATPSSASPRHLPVSETLVTKCSLLWKQHHSRRVALISAAILPSLVTFSKEDFLRAHSWQCLETSRLSVKPSALSER